MRIQEKILLAGKSAGMCNQFQSELQSGEKTIDELCSMYHRGLDFCIDKHFPSKEIVALFNPIDLARNGIYYDTTNYDILNQKHIVVNGKSDVDIYVDRISDIYVRDNSKARLHIRDGAFVYVTLRDNAEVSVVMRGANTRICASLFSGTIVNEEQFDIINRK